MYMFCLRSGIFGVAAIEKKREKELYQNRRTNWKQTAAENGIEKHVFIIENVFGLNVKKLHNITFRRYTPILHIKSENVFDRS